SYLDRQTGSAGGAYQNVVVFPFGGDPGRGGRVAVRFPRDLLSEEFGGRQGVFGDGFCVYAGEPEGHCASTRLTTMWDRCPVLGLVQGRGGPTIASSRPSAMPIWSAAVRSASGGKYPTQVTFPSAGPWCSSERAGWTWQRVSVVVSSQVGVPNSSGGPVRVRVTICASWMRSRSMVIAAAPTGLVLCRRWGVHGPGRWLAVRFWFCRVAG